MKIIGYHLGLNSIANSEGEIRTQSPWLDWLLSQSEPGTIQCFYNLDADVARLLRLIDIDVTEGRKLIRNGRLYIAPYTLRYIPKKFFSIDKGFGRGHSFATFNDIAQYNPPASNGIDSNPNILLVRANKAAEVGMEVYQILTSLGLEVNSLVSPVRAFQRSVLNKLDIPTVDDVPRQAGEFAYYCCKGSWLECFKRGHFDTWDYDISSGYPYYVSLLPDIRQGKWIHSKKMESPPSLSQEAGSYIGFYKGKVTITSDFSPILYKPERDLSYTPRGTWETYITDREWAFILQYNLGTFECEEGWRWEPDVSLRHLGYPLQQTMHWLHSEKSREGELRREVIKRIMAGLYGKMLEVRQFEKAEMGPLFNPVYAAEIETNTRLEVARFALDNGIVPLHIAVDGLLADRELPIVESGAMGSWKLTSRSPALIMGSGAVAVKDRKGVGDFSLDYDMLIKFAREHPEATNYIMKKNSPLTLAKTLNLGRWDSLGLLIDNERSVEFLTEEKRMYIKEPQQVSDLLSCDFESVPWDVSILRKVT